MRRPERGISKSTDSHVFFMHSRFGGVYRDIYINVSMKRGIILLAFCCLFIYSCSNDEGDKYLPEGQMTVSLSDEAGIPVDLGLSVLWSDRYVGADSPEESGDYFAWGEVEPKERYDKENYKFNNIEPPILIHGTEHDAARMNWGGKWRLPTLGELHELKEKSTLSGGPSGCTVTGPNGNSIYFALTSFRYGDKLYRPVDDICGWSSHRSQFWEFWYCKTAQGDYWAFDATWSVVAPQDGYCVRAVMDK